MTLATAADQSPIRPPSYHSRPTRALHLDALTLVRRWHLLALCRVAVRLAQQRCPPPLPAGPGGAPRVYRDESLLLLALLRRLWRLSYQELHDWLVEWPALARACGLPLGPDGRLRVPSKAQQSKRGRAAGAPESEVLFVLLVRAGLWMSLTLIAWIHTTLHARAVIPWNPKRQKKRDGLPPTWTVEELGKRTSIERFFGRVLIFFRL